MYLPHGEGVRASRGGADREERDRNPKQTPYCQQGAQCQGQTQEL